MAADEFAAEVELPEVIVTPLANMKVPRRHRRGGGSCSPWSTAKSAVPGRSAAAAAWPRWYRQTDELLHSLPIGVRSLRHPEAPSK